MSNQHPQRMSREQLIRQVQDLRARVEELEAPDKPGGERYRQLFENMRSAVAVYEAVDEGADFVFTSFNRAAAEIDQADPADVIGKRVTEAFPGVAEFGLLEVFRSVWKDGRPQSHPISFYQDDRIAGWRENMVFRLPNGEVVAIYEDRTKEKQIEAELRYHADLLENLSDAVVSTDHDHVIRSWNKAAEEIYGYSEEEAIGRSTTELLKVEYVEDREAALRTLIETGFWSGDTVQYAKGGRALRILASVKVVRDEDGKLLGVVGINRDVGEQRELEAKLAQNERLASLGLLAAGVAHEINNPLTYVLYNLEQLAKRLGELAQPAEPLRLLTALAASSPGEHLSALHSFSERALEGAERVKQIVKDLNAFAHVGDEGLQAVQVNDVLRTAIKFAGNEIRFRARLQDELGVLPRIMVNEGKLAQVFVNLLVNAAHSIEEGDREGNLIRVRTWMDEGQIAISVRDSGQGIPQQHLPRIFDPFFTTKEIGKGSGLGLSICHSIVSGIGGSIQVRSAPGQGSCFLVRLPCNEPKSGPAGSAAPARALRRHSILVVDDEPMIADVINRMLRADQDVTIASSGEQALELLAASPPFDAIICDLMMPGLTGMDVHAWLQERRDALAERMLFISGGAFTPGSKAFLSRIANPVIYKPFDRKALLDALCQVLPQT